MLSYMRDRGHSYSGTAVQMPQLQEVSAHFSQFCIGPVSSLDKNMLHPSGLLYEVLEAQSLILIAVYTGIDIFQEIFNMNTKYQ